MSVKIYHNPRCSKSRRALELLTNRGLEPEIVEYLRNPLSSQELKEILELLDKEPRQLLRTGESAYSENNLDDPRLDAEQIVEAMIAHPILIERPIVVSNGRAVVGRPPEKVLEIL